MSFYLIAKLLVTYSACNDTSVPFLCQFVFPLCDCKTGNLYSPQETCQEVSTVTCRILWPQLEQLIPFKLPHCSVLSITTYPLGLYMYTVIWNKSLLYHM